MVSPRTALVVCGGGPVLAPWALPPAPDVVIAADDGAREALRLGLEVDVVVGDMDSVPASTLAQVERAGGRVMRHPADKDATDLELALDEALTSQAQRFVVAGGAGGGRPSWRTPCAGASATRRGRGGRGVRGRLSHARPR
jgi:thiamine pyrophosphokinase